MTVDAFTERFPCNISAIIGNQYAVLNGRYIYLPLGVQSISGRPALPLSSFAKVSGGYCKFFPDYEGVYTIITRSEPSLKSGRTYYNEIVVDLMAHCIYSEAGNQTLAGKIAVGNVIVNRYYSPAFPNDFYSVIHSPGQFDGTLTHWFRKDPTEECYVAAKIALERIEMMPGVLYFNTHKLNSWASHAKTYLGTIGDHDFFR